jgi:hypothetical protein
MTSFLTYILFCFCVQNDTEPRTFQTHPSVSVSNTTTAATTTTTTTTTPKKKKKWKDIEARKPSVTFKDFGGSSRVIQVGFFMCFIYNI